MINTARKHLTVQDCMMLNDAGYEIYVNDGLVYTNYEEDSDEEYHDIPDDLATPSLSAFS